MKGFARDKYSSLLQIWVNYGRRNITLAPGVLRAYNFRILNF
jgi:hypothetical protein